MTAAVAERAEGWQDDDPGPEPVAPGEELAPGYLAVELLRRGSAFDVYDAWSVALHCRCVVKLVRPDHPESAALRRRLLAEGRLMLRLNHPHLQRAYEVRSDPALVVSQTVGGATLRSLLDDGRRRLGAGDLALLGSQLASALSYLHGLGRLHLDVKPGNVLVDAGITKLIDFSLAHRLVDGRCRVRPRTGTFGYASPEQARGGVVGPAADVWGLGATLFRAATGLRVVAADDDAAGPDGLRLGGSAAAGATSAAATTAPPTVRSLRRGLVRDVGEVVDACLALDPADRPPLGAVLARFDELSGDGPPRPRG